MVNTIKFVRFIFIFIVTLSQISHTIFFIQWTCKPLITISRLETPHKEHQLWNQQKFNFLNLVAHKFFNSVHPGINSIPIVLPDGSVLTDLGPFYGHLLVFFIQLRLT